MTTSCPNRLDSSCATKRPIVSIGPPGGNGTIILISRVGYCCDAAGAAAMSQAQGASSDASTIRLAFIAVLSRFLFPAIAWRGGTDHERSHCSRSEVVLTANLANARHAGNVPAGTRCDRASPRRSLASHRPNGQHRAVGMMTHYPPWANDVMRLLMLIRIIAVTILVLCPVARAQSPADFNGRNIDLYIGYSAGGGYDVYARLLARHMGRLIAGNPAIVPRNMPGAGSLVLANWLYNVAPRDGTAFGMIGRGTMFDPLLGSTKAQFDASK